MSWDAVCNMCSGKNCHKCYDTPDGFEERTCTLKSVSYDTLQCSSCGCTFCHFVPDEFIQSGIYYCPNCGAKVVEE